MSFSKECMFAARVSTGWHQSVQVLVCRARAVDLPFIGTIFLVTRILLILATWLAAPLSRPAILSHAVSQPFFHTWNQWDAQHYATIALHGYGTTGDPGLPAFFPLFPLLERLTSPLTGGDIAVAGLLVANGSWLVALLVLGGVARAVGGTEAARGAVVALSAFPTAFFGFVAYPEALFLALALGSFHHMRRGRWWLAGVLGMMAALTRQSGALLLLPFLWEFGCQHGWSWGQRWWSALWGLAIPGGIGLYALFLWRAAGDPLAFVHAQALWHRGWVWPPITIVEGFWAIFHQPIRYFVFRAWQEWIVVMVLILLAIQTIRRLPGAFAIFAVPTLLLFLAQPARDWPLLSQSRLALELFPLFITLGIWLAAQQWRWWLYIAICLPLQLAFGIIFSHGGWVI